MTVRIIPRLEIKGPNLVKGIRFEGLRVLGKPEAFARAYYEAGADELIYVDAVASLYGRNSLLHMVERTAREVFKTAESVSDQPTCDLLTQRMQVHEKTAWMLRSMLAG